MTASRRPISSCATAVAMSSARWRRGGSSDLYEDVHANSRSLRSSDCVGLRLSTDPANAVAGRAFEFLAAVDGAPALDSTAGHDVATATRHAAGGPSDPRGEDVRH